MTTKAPLKVSSKSTKNEILEAYNEALSQLSEPKEIDPVEINKMEKQKNIVLEASKNSPETIVSYLARLKISLIKQIDILSENLTTEFKKLEDIKQAIDIEKNHLDELYKIKETAQSLSALILARKEKQEKFDQEVNDSKKSWEKEQENIIQEYKEQKESLDKKQKREKEEYEYNLELSRRKEENEYQEKRKLIEKELEEKKSKLDEKEKELKSREEETIRLKTKVDEFPQELEKTISKAKKEVTEELTNKYKFEMELKEKEITGDKKLYSQIIKSFEEKIKEQEKLIDQLTQKADTASNQVQTMACKALETSSQRLVNTYSASQSYENKNKESQK
ncbi:MAG: hypothetical protein ABIA74_05910 [bacterium]